MSRRKPKPLKVHLRDLHPGDVIFWSSTVFMAISVVHDVVGNWGDGPYTQVRWLHKDGLKTDMYDTQLDSDIEFNVYARCESEP